MNYSPDGKRYWSIENVGTNGFIKPRSLLRDNSQLEFVNPRGAESDHAQIRAVGDRAQSSIRQQPTISSPSSDEGGLEKDLPTRDYVRKQHIRKKNCYSYSSSSSSLEELTYVPVQSLQIKPIEDRSKVQSYFSDYYKRGRSEFNNFMTSPQVDIYSVDVEGVGEEFVFIWMELGSQKGRYKTRVPNTIKGHFRKVCICRSDLNLGYNGCYVLYPRNIDVDYLRMIIQTYAYGAGLSLDKSALVGL